MEIYCDFVVSTAIAANISQVPASRMRFLARVLIQDHMNDLQNIQSQVLCGQSVQMSAESCWGVQCLKQKSASVLEHDLYEALSISPFLSWVI
jgi:hypothetical protein